MLTPSRSLCLSRTDPTSPGLTRAEAKAKGIHCTQALIKNAVSTFLPAIWAWGFKRGPRRRLPKQFAPQSVCRDQGEDRKQLGAGCPGVTRTRDGLCTTQWEPSFSLRRPFLGCRSVAEINRDLIQSSRL